jgi:hypothetical protein
MSSTSRRSRAELVMDCIAVADLALLVSATLIFIAGSPALPFSAENRLECAAACAARAAAVAHVAAVEPAVRRAARGEARAALRRAPPSDP